MSTAPTTLAQGVSGITEDDIAHYLVHNPGFFDRHAQLLAAVQLVSPHGARAVSLQERQIEMLRDRIKGMERRAVDMMRAGQDNDVLAGRLHRWTCSMLLAADGPALEQALTTGLQHEFMVPQVALRAWGLAPEHAALGMAAEVSEEARAFAGSLPQPYCGLNASFEASKWFDESATIQSVALVPLRTGANPQDCFGMLALGSPDALRYQSDMGVDLLEQIGDIASAALSRLR